MRGLAFVFALALALMPSLGPAATQSEPIPLEIRPVGQGAPSRQAGTYTQGLHAGQAPERPTGPYIDTDPQTGDRVLGVSRPEPGAQAPESSVIIVVPEIELPAKLPREPVMVYRPGGDAQPPGVYRPAE